ncbi:unnamed protein product [Nesidiocoris tenuis]|uniref:Uncharacterized protein n=1 Tax=Nesidiocoris tenuis TaxID=355587 RepID=A0A6H5HHP4_9HEMI|nr:unnamed protein product [Nesidiocoris tenuis]
MSSLPSSSSKLSFTETLGAMYPVFIGGEMQQMATKKLTDKPREKRGDGIISNNPHRMNNLNPSLTGGNMTTWPSSGLHHDVLFVYCFK